jgi:hypothetical protein
MGISSGMKAFHKFFIAVTRGVPTFETKVMFETTRIYFINRCPWTAAARSTPSIPWKNTER